MVERVLPGAGVHDQHHLVGCAGIEFRILFVDASDEVLVRRFETVRRPHPLQASYNFV